MPKIVSNPSQDLKLLGMLQDILSRELQAIHGLEPAPDKLSKDPEKIVEHLDVILKAYRTSFTTFERLNSILESENAILRVELEIANDYISKVIEDVGYDEALDSATEDFMQSLTASGAAESTVDGLLAFDSRITLSKGDFKPILRDAIVQWIEKRLSK